MAKNAIADEDWARFASELGRKMHQLRIRHGLSQEELAYSAGLSRYTYQKFEKGESRPGDPSNPHLRTVAAIAAALGLPLTELLPEWTPRVRF